MPHLAATLRQGDRSRMNPRPVLVPSATARIPIAGQAPGHAGPRELGKPFTDPSATACASWLGVDAGAVLRSRYVRHRRWASVFRDRRQGAPAAAPDRAPTWRGQVMAAMPQVDLVLAVGVPLRPHSTTRRGASLTDTVEDWRRFCRRRTADVVIPLPASVLGATAVG